MTADEQHCDITKNTGRKIALLITGFIGRCVHTVAKEMDMKQFKIVENYKER